MKCPKCNGYGKVGKYKYYKTCPTCGGTGEIPQSNEDYIRLCTTEELAELLAKIQTDEYELPVDTAYIDAWKSWLKENHDY